MSYCKHTALGAAFFAAAWVTALHADVRMPAIFGDHMVLQEGAKLPVWGTAAPGENVTVTIGTETASATADPSGKWQVALAPLPSGSAPLTMTVAGKNTLTFTDVLIGEVWICSGQSNMEFGILPELHSKETIPQATDPAIRLFLVPHQIGFLAPMNDIAPVPAADLPGKWQICTPQTLGSGHWGWNGFSAVGYYFARDIRQSTGKPIGMIETAWGGMPSQAFTSLSGLEKDPEGMRYVNEHNKFVADFAKNSAVYPGLYAAYLTQLATWQAAEAKALGLKLGTIAPPSLSPPPGFPQKPFPPRPPDGGPNGAANLYNGMIAPLIPYAIKGAIWYQGEANAGRAVEYRTIFGRLIKDWREKWNEGDFPFFWVQLASYKAGVVPNWPYLRESQAQTLALPQTGMATAVDIGDPNNIHPIDKLDVGDRLALLARDIAYGEKRVDSGPVYNAMQPQANSIRLTFTNKGGGLLIGQAPWVAPHMSPLPADHLVGFQIAGADQKFVDADAKIDGDSVVVSSPQVALPAAVRYDWANICLGNLYNKDGLPAPPFRTDDWIDAKAMGLYTTTPPVK
jgi:sialate O-acetylesterase